MPYYVFVCQNCHKDFTQVLHISELSTTKVKCPHCGSEHVEQQFTEFSAVTAKKS